MDRTDISGNNRTNTQECSRADNRDSTLSNVIVGTAATLGSLAVAGLAYWFSRPSPTATTASAQPPQKQKPQNKAKSNINQTHQPSESRPQASKPKQIVIGTTKTKPPQDPESRQRDTSVSDYLEGLLNKMNTPSNSSGTGKKGIPKSSIPSAPVISNLNALLSDIYLRYVALNDEEFKKHYKVYEEVFRKLDSSMKEVDNYYKKYSSRKQFAGSHFDNLRIEKPDEFDVDIVIELPLNIKADPQNPAASDIVFEQKGSSFVQLRMGKQFQNLPLRDANEWQINRTAYEWKDDTHYLLRSKFTDWFKGVVTKALNKHLNSTGKPEFYVDGVPYTVRRSESGPAITIYIENLSRGFKLDVDLVPAIKFPEERWPVGPRYRDIPPGCNAKQRMFMVVPKFDKGMGLEIDRNRAWRLAMHDQEAGLMYNNNNMKQGIRLMKKLRDSMNMREISSYYVKTLFFWEAIERNDKSFWTKSNPAQIFKIMVKRLHDALVEGKIPYFWYRQNNMIANVDKGVLKRHSSRLAKLLLILDDPKEYKQVAKYLLNDEEFLDYNTKYLRI